MIRNDSMNSELSELQLLREIDRMEQRRCRWTAVRRIVFLLVTVIGFALMVMNFWFPIFLADQGQVVLGIRTEDLQKGELAVIRQSNTVAICRILALPGEFVDHNSISASRVPSDSLLIELVAQDPQEMCVIQEDEILAKIICSLWPLQLPVLFE